MKDKESHIKSEDSRIRAQFSEWYSSVEILVISAEESYTPEITWKKYDPSLFIPPTFTIKRQHAQELIDDLWHCGFRPSQARAGDSTLQSTKDHLNDMRALAFSSLEIEKPKD